MRFFYRLIDSLLQKIKLTLFMCRVSVAKVLMRPFVLLPFLSALVSPNLVYADEFLTSCKFEMNKEARRTFNFKKRFGGLDFRFQKKGGKLQITQLKSADVLYEGGKPITTTANISTYEKTITAVMERRHKFVFDLDWNNKLQVTLYRANNAGYSRDADRIGPLSLRKSGCEKMTGSQLHQRILFPPSKSEREIEKPKVAEAKPQSLKTTKSAISKEPLIVSDKDPNCAKLRTKIAEHIENEKYELASKAKTLMNDLSCSSKIVSSQNQQNMQPKYSTSQLRCNVGPLGKTIFGEYGKYRASAVDDSPQKACSAAGRFCKTRSRAIAEGAAVQPLNTNRKKSYSGSCDTSTVGSFSNTDCTLYENGGGGGFAGGLAEGLSKGLNEVAQRKRIYESNFKICMLDMGYQITKRK
jgi:hypothetical protein